MLKRQDYDIQIGQYYDAELAAKPIQEGAPRKIVSYKLTNQGTAYEVEAIGPKGNRFLIRYDGEKGRFEIYAKYDPKSGTYKAGDSKYYNKAKGKEVALLYLGQELVDQLEAWTVEGNKKTPEGFAARLKLEDVLGKMQPKPAQQAAIKKETTEEYIAPSSGNLKSPPKPKNPTSGNTFDVEAARDDKVEEVEETNSRGDQVTKYRIPVSEDGTPDRYDPDTIAVSYTHLTLPTTPYV